MGAPRGLLLALSSVILAACSPAAEPLGADAPEGREDREDEPSASGDEAGDPPLVPGPSAATPPAPPASKPLGPCADGAWTCVDVPAAGPYGTRSFDVPAAQNWVNTGLYLKAGETASLQVSGTWKAHATKEGQAIDHGPCKIGSAIARIGLYYKDAKLTCLGASTTFTADKDGILFVGALSENDLGESYEARIGATGKKRFTVKSEGQTVPSIPASAATTYPLADVRSGWIEIFGEHAILTVPVATAIRDAQTTLAAAKRLDDIYELHQQLRGAVPQHGQRLRWFPDETSPGYMLAGNPIRVKAALVTGGDTTRITRAGEAGTDNWGFAHEMGHDFSFATGFWGYQPKSLEAWPNVFSRHAFEKLGLPLHDATADCKSSSNGTYSTTEAWSPWVGLCFLMQFQFAHGWGFYERFFRAINTNHTMPDAGSSEKTAWYFVHDRFEEAAKTDVTAEFAAWNVPHP